jgi:hypothetical protein
MELWLERLTHGRGSTLSAFFIDGRFRCFVCEDEPRAVKVAGETRIPAGRYALKLRTIGGKHERYLAKFGAPWHAGMLWLQDVPGFEYVEIHPGNDQSDTDGCLLPGLTGFLHDDGGGHLGNSVLAYQKIYPPIRDALLTGRAVWITVTDRDA